MNGKVYKWIACVLLCLVVVLAWQSFVMYKQMVNAAFIHSQCETTQKEFIDDHVDPRALAQRLEFLVGYYNYYSKTLDGSQIAHIVWRNYCQTLTNSVTAFRLATTNDLGNDPKLWIQKYGN